MLRGGVLKWATRALPFALVVGLIGVGSATTATALGPAILVGITVTPAVGTVEAGATQQFHATGIYSDSSTQDLTNAVTWSSSSSSTATISNAPGSEGLATAVAEGAATITASYPSALISGTAALTVTPLSSPIPATLVAVTVSPAVSSVAAGATQQFTATGIYSDSSTQNLTDVVTWSSSVAGTATISNASGSQGLATAVADGATTITATDPSTPISGTAALTVTPVAPPPMSPAASPAQLVTTPKSGKRKAPITASGDHFSPGGVVTVTYLSGLKSRKRASTVLCSTTVAQDGTFSCGGTVPRMARSGKKGQHTIVAVGPDGTKSTSTFTLVRR